MIKYNYNGRDIILRKANYSDGHLCILIDDGEETERLSTNFSQKDCERFLGKNIQANEILICMTPNYEHPIIRSLAFSLEEDGLIACMWDFIRTYNEYYRYRIFDKTMGMLESKEIIEWITEQEEEPEEWGEW